LRGRESRQTSENLGESRLLTRPFSTASAAALKDASAPSAAAPPPAASPASASRRSRASASARAANERPGKAESPSEESSSGSRPLAAESSASATANAIVRPMASVVMRPSAPPAAELELDDQPYPSACAAGATQHGRDDLPQASPQASPGLSHRAPTRKVPTPRALHPTSTAQSKVPSCVHARSVIRPVRSQPRSAEAASRPFAKVTRAPGRRTARCSLSSCSCSLRATCCGSARTAVSVG